MKGNMSLLVGHQTRQSDKINNLIQELVGEVTKNNSQLTGICPPREEHKEAGKQKVDLAGQFRGRPLHYP
ncbi:MAG: acetylornithine aminotransferase, partial [Bdellovibrio sp.]